MDSSIFFVQFCWLTLLMFPSNISCEILCLPNERETLLKFKDHLFDSSNRLSSWNPTSNLNCCEWSGVVCSNVTAHVEELHLNMPPPPSDLNWYDFAKYEAYKRSRFGGDINPCLIDLKHLKYFDLSGNYFGGMQIPTFIGTITSLTYLNLSHAGFSGNIPHQIGNLSNLHYLDLRNGYFYPHAYTNFEGNQFSGEIPYQIGNLKNLLHLDIGNDDKYYELSLFAENLHWLSGLSSLQYLDLSSVNLSKSFDWLKVMQTLPSLMELHLSTCPILCYNCLYTVNLSSLVNLDLSYSYDLGTSFFPRWICGLTKLVSLQLIDNNIQGLIPDCIQNLTLLQNLDLSFNSFSSSIFDWLYGLRHLKLLNLASNNLHGTIPDMLGNMTSLEVLDLSYNQFEGNISTSFGNFCYLRELYLSDLKLNQQVNEILEILTPCVSLGLEALDISSSRLSGHLTNQIGLFNNLLYLDLANNSIHGALPTPIGKLSSLEYLYLSKNQLKGNPFESLRSLSNLTDFEISDNLFQGVVKEDDLENLTTLKNFYASGNNFSLKVDPNWHPTFQVDELRMSSWNLGPSFPSWIRSQKDLYSLEMSNTGISDYIPTWFWETFSQAYHLNLSHNHIYGQLSSALQNLTSTTLLDLSSNYLTGQLSPLPDNMIVLDLSNNLFSESMAELLCKNLDKPKNLQFLNLASNNLSGEIPNCWQMWPYIVDVNLQNNHLVGNLPPSMGSLAWLKSLQLRNNTLSGKFPRILRKTYKLISLDLQENKFSGSIPGWIGERLKNLKYFQLRSNKFLSHIPNQICSLKFLQVLDLAENNLSGKIPSCFNQLNAMTQLNKSTQSLIYFTSVNNTNARTLGAMLLWLKGRSEEYRNFLGLVTIIDLSNNKLSGDIPRDITNLDGLNSLNLSHNQLTGHIPPSIGNMRSLQSIDFSKNQLSGEIPPSISNLSFLNFLNLSWNHLRGKIPTGTQLQTFEASSFVGNILCGQPLLINCSLKGKISNYVHVGNWMEKHSVKWPFVSMVLGFVVGFWIVVAPLFIYESWRYVYFSFFDYVWFRIQLFGTLVVTILCNGN